MSRLRRSIYAHQIKVSEKTTLLLHAVSQLRLKVDTEVSQLIDYFVEWRPLPQVYDELKKLVSYDQKILEACLNKLVECGFLTAQSVEDEATSIAEKLGQTYGRDPGELLDRYRQQTKVGADPRWSLGAARSLKDLGKTGPHYTLALFGDCELHMETDFLRQEAAHRGFALEVAATASDDFSFAHEHKHDAIIIGSLYARHTLLDTDSAEAAPIGYIAQARYILENLRRHTQAPIFLDNLPEPTVEPLGMGEPSVDGHRNRFRITNLALAELAEEFQDVYIIDVAAGLAAVGSFPLLDDWQVGFTHLGSAGWMLQRPEREKEAVYHQMPEISQLIELIGPDPYKREHVMANLHLNAFVTALGIDQKKCVIVDLDNTLWPGILAETGAPFAWTPDISGAFSYIGLYFGLHEALLCLKHRGIVLACVSKNDEAIVRKFWTYPSNYPLKRLLTFDDFVTTRINWKDKVSNIQSIADELGFALNTFIFIDDHPTERDRVKTFMPDIEVWGENAFNLRHRLLTDPRLQTPHLTQEASRRSDLVKAQLQRQKKRASTQDEAAYITSLELVITVGHPQNDADIARIEELFKRTTQFNTTGTIFSSNDLKQQAQNQSVFILHVSDKFGDHGLVGAAVIDQGVILGLVMSCRVLSMGVEHKFMSEIIQASQNQYPWLKGQIRETNRNTPVRHIYRDHGFTLAEDGYWTLSLKSNH